MPASIVTGRRRPHEQLVCLWAILSAAGVLAQASRSSNALDALFPTWLATTWYVLLLVGGVTGLTGAWWSRQRIVTGLLLEAASMSLLGVVCCVYTISLFVTAGSAAWTAGLLVGAISVSCGWRWIQIKRDLRLLREALRRAP